MANLRLRSSALARTSAGRMRVAGFLIAIGLAAFAMVVNPTEAQAQARTLAPELLGGAGWLGTDQPILLKQLRGKIVILEFWTEC